jgi:predicted Ser/Thr protein kinase
MVISKVPVRRPLRPIDPKRLGCYELTARLGEGGQGIVYLGRAPGGRDVAVKMLHAWLGEDRRARRRFAQELKAAQQVDPFCTAQIIDAEIGADLSYIVSEYIDGPSLREAVKGTEPLSGGALHRLAIGTATALVAIHRAAVVHRDLKPSNVLLGPDGPRVIDFGTARLLDGAWSTSQHLGTPAYMAPEQIKDSRMGPEGDVFAWGSTMAYAANGYPPFGSDYVPVIINRILRDEPELGRLAEPLRGLVAACLDKDPGRRPTAWRILGALLGDATILSSPAPMATPAAAKEPPALSHVAPHTANPVRSKEPPDANQLDTGMANVARIYDAVLGGKENFSVDREIARQLVANAPETTWIARQNRAFLARAVRYCAERGIRQFLDLGSGLPTQNNVHEVARRVDPACRVVYVDIDPVAVAHAGALLDGGAGVAAILGDLTEPTGILGNSQVRRLIDFSRPVCVLMVAILHFFDDCDDPAGIVARYADAIARGSHLVLSHATHDMRPEQASQARYIYREAAAPLCTRSREEVGRLLAGWQLLDPGLVFTSEWRPRRPIPHPERAGLYAAVARKP